MTDAHIAALLKPVLAGGPLAFEDAVGLLGVSPDSSAALLLRGAAHQASLSWSGGRGSVWFAIGLDSSPCPKNCGFCAFGEKWGVVRQAWRLDEEEALGIIREHDVPGVGVITLRITDAYPLEDLLRLALKAGPLKHARLVANAGDLDESAAKALREAGFHMVYHALRLREGIDTRLDPAARLRTMRASAEASLQLAALVDPVGSEHSDEEIARSIFVHREAGASVSGAMARVAVPGTPKYGVPTVAPSRLAQITAVARLAGGPETLHVCSHPADEALVFSGANTLVVERGGIPRDTLRTRSDWRSFTLRDALALLARAGYRTHGPS